MLGRIFVAALVLGLAATAAPLAGFSPVGNASANFVQIDGVDDCFNACTTAAGVLRHLPKAPPVHCTA